MDLPWLGVCGELVWSALKLGVGIWCNDKYRLIKMHGMDVKINKYIYIFNIF